MLAAEAFHGKILWHSEYNPQGITVESLENYGAKLGDKGFEFGDGSRGHWRPDGNFPDGSDRWVFVADAIPVTEEDDGLMEDDSH